MNLAAWTIVLVIALIFVLMVKVFFNNKRDAYIREQGANNSRVARTRNSKKSTNQLTEADIFIQLFVIRCRGEVEKTGNKISNRKLNSDLKQYQKTYQELMGHRPPMKTPYVTIKDILRKEGLKS